MNDMIKHGCHRRIGVALVMGVLYMGCGANTDDAQGVDDAEQAGEAEHVEVVVLDSAAISFAGITTAQVEESENRGLPATGSIAYDANRVSHVGARTEGRIVSFVADLGQRVEQGQPLAILESAEVGEVRAQRHEAEALVRIAAENYEREGRLQQQGISSRKELLDAEAELRRAEAALRGAAERLQALGALVGEGAQFAVSAPLSGIVVERDANLGETVSPEDHLFTVADLERVWLELDIYERDLSSVERGQTVEVITAAYPDRTFLGAITYVGDIVDVDRRTVRTRVEIPNSDRALRPGMFATVRILVGDGDVPVVVVPQDAVQQVEGRTVVFVPGDLAGEFRAHAVEVGETDDRGRVTILSGLSAGDLVVVSGAFALRSELAKGELAEEGH